MKTILYMRNGGVIITETYREGDNIATLGKRMVQGGGALFKDSLWSHPRQLAVNLADVSVIEVFEERE